MSKLKLKKTNLTMISLIIIFILFLTISIGYSCLQQKLNIYGKSTIIADESGKYINGNSTYSYKIINSQKQEESNYIIYDVKLTIVNMDNDIGSWEISFDVPKGYNDFISNIKEGFSKKYENGRLTIYSENGYLSKGNTLELEIQFAIDGEFSINNLTLNGKLASEII